MFNPLGGETLRDTLENTRCSLSQKPRAIRIAYYNSKYQSVLEALEWLVKVHEFDTFGGHRVTSLFQNALGAKQNAPDSGWSRGTQS